MDRRLQAALLLWCGALSLLARVLLVVLESAIHQVLHSLLHDVGRLGYGR